MIITCPVCNKDNFFLADPERPLLLREKTHAECFNLIQKSFGQLTKKIDDLFKERYAPLRRILLPAINLGLTKTSPHSLEKQWYKERSELESKIIEAVKNQCLNLTISQFHKKFEEEGLRELFKIFGTEAFSDFENSLSSQWQLV